MEIDDELGRQLHDRATRGHQLSDEEQARLQAWNDQWDRIEMEQLGLTPERVATEEAELAELRAIVEAEEAQVTELAESNWRLSEQNDALRAEIEVLRRNARLPAQPFHTPQPVG